MRLLTKLSGDARDPDAGFQVVAGRPDDLQRLMVVSGRRSTGASDGPVHVHLGDEVLRVAATAAKEMPDKAPRFTEVRSNSVTAERSLLCILLGRRE